MRFSWDKSRRAVIAASLVGTFHAPTSAQDLELGERVFERQCAACHEIGVSHGRRVGPNLTGVYGAPAGSVEGYKYSTGMASAGSEGLVWNDETLDAFLLKPRSYVGKTRMSYRGLRDEAERAAVIAYLGLFPGVSDATTGEAAPTVADAPQAGSESASAPTALLAIEGDVVYGEYLAAECTSCHRLSGQDDGIPSIVGWPRENFLAAMVGYRSGARDHQVMRMVAQSLGDEELAALAVFFAEIDASE